MFPGFTSAALRVPLCRRSRRGGLHASWHHPPVVHRRAELNASKVTRMANRPYTNPDSPVHRDLLARDFAGGDAGFSHIETPSADADLLPNRNYPSPFFWRLARSLNPEAAPSKILDLGPTSNTNIQFWVRRGFQVSCYDLFAREAMSLSVGPVSPMSLAAESIRERQLPYAQESFSAICAWNVFSRLPFVLAHRYIRECYRVLHPSGLMHAIFLDVHGRPDSMRRYEAAEHNQLTVRSRGVPDTLPRAWLDAEIVLLFSHFDACGTLPAPCQTREVLVQRQPVNHFPSDHRRW